MSPEVNQRTHRYQAQATILSGSLQLPLVHEIRPQARIDLPGEGGYLCQRADNYRLEGVISFRSAYTQVAGNLSTKPGQGWTTLTTTVIEGLNILEVVTADRIVGQTVTEHPLVGYVPSVHFLGTRFENLRIAGHPIHLDLDLDVLGAKPVADGSYTTEPGVMAKAKAQCGRILENNALPAPLRDRYNQVLSSVGGQERLECSLVNHAAGVQVGQSFGHVIDIPDFGKVILGKLTVTSEDFVQGTKSPRKTTIQLTMIDLELGCAVAGGGSFGSGSTNGTTMP